VVLFPFYFSLAEKERNEKERRLQQEGIEIPGSYAARLPPQK
jgi:hypothetical protein